MIKKKYFAVLSFLFLLLHPLYVYILNTFHLYQTPLTVISLVFLFIYCGVNIKVSKRTIRFLIPWTLLFIIMALNNKNDNLYMLFYFVVLLFMLIYSNKNNWQEPFIKLLHIMTFPNAVATILFWIAPSVYPFIKSMIFTNDIMYAGYKTALTGHYSTNAIYISISLLISGCMLLQKNTSINKNKYCIMFIVELFALVLTSKRGPFLFSILALFITYILVDKNRFFKRSIKLLTIILSSLVFIYTFAEYIPGFNDIFVRFYSDGTSGRDAMYGLALKMFSESPIFGVGTGSYRLYYSKFLATDINHMYLNAHNVYLQILCENGIVGLLLFLIAAIYCLYKSVILLRKYFMIEDNKNELIISISVAFQLYFLLYCITGNPLYDNMMYIPYFMFCAVSYSFLEIERNVN